MKESTQSIRVIDAREPAGETHLLQVERGANLRAALLRHELTPYHGIFQSMNCGGLGICGSCKVLVRENGHWWERRSCQIRCFQSLEIKIQ